MEFPDILNLAWLQYKKHLGRLLFGSAIFAFATLVGDYLRQATPFMIALPISLAILFFGYAYFLVYCHIVVSGGAPSWGELNRRLKGRWTKYLLVGLVVIHRIARAFFPFLLPAFKTGIELIFASPLTLLEENPRIDVFEHSRRLIEKDFWNFVILLFGFWLFYSLGGILAFFFHLGPMAAAFSAAALSFFISPFVNVFYITYWVERRRIIEVIESEQMTVEALKNTALTTLPGAIGGFLYLIVIMMIPLAILAYMAKMAATFGK